MRRCLVSYIYRWLQTSHLRPRSPRARRAAAGPVLPTLGHHKQRRIKQISLAVAMRCVCVWNSKWR